METRIDGRDGWVEVTRAGVHVLAKGDDSLRERLEAALAQAGDESPADVVTDELTTGGVRRTPDFAIVAEGEGRVLVRGTASVQLTDAAGTTGEVVAPARGPWADEDLAPGTQSALLATGEPEPAPAGPQLTEDGWAIPSVFAGGAGAAGAAGAAQQEPAVLDEPARTRDGADADDELPGDGFLLGSGSQQQPETAPEASGAPISSGPVAAAGGYQPPDNPVNATLAPVGDEEQEGPGAASRRDDGDRGTLAEPAGTGEHAIDPAASAAVADGNSAGPGASAPQFVDGHLVSGRAAAGGAAAPSGADSSGVPHSSDSAGAAAVASAGAAPAAAAAGTAAATPETDQDLGSDAGQFAGRDAGEGAGQGVAPEGADAGTDQSEDPGLFTQIIEGDPAVPAHTEPTNVDDTGELPAGPVVLAVRCAQGHHSAPHATRCRICGQELPTQQPEPTVRPALGLLRLSTGDVVTLDRGVLIGRAPRAAQETENEPSPHLVRVASPDNEISRNHVEVVLDGWHVLVRDLGSTNGTTVALPGSSPVRVRPGDQQTIEPGTTVALADQVSMTFEITE